VKLKYVGNLPGNWTATSLGRFEEHQTKKTTNILHTTPLSNQGQIRHLSKAKYDAVVADFVTPPPFSI